MRYASAGWCTLPPMQAFTGLVLAASALLALSAVPKLAVPTSTILALRSVGMAWAGPKTVRSLAGLELAVGVGAIVVGGRVVDGVVALLYAGFSAFLVLALGRPGASCGCTGRHDTPPTASHLVMTTVFTAGAVAAAVPGGHTGLWLLSRSGHPGEVLIVGALAMLATWLGWAILNLPGSLARVRRRLRRG
jgi:hypothetical protein